MPWRRTSSRVRLSPQERLKEEEEVDEERDNLLQALAMNEVDAVRHLANQEEEIEDKSEE